MTGKTISSSNSTWIRGETIDPSTMLGRDAGKLGATDALRVNAAMPGWQVDNCTIRTTVAGTDFSRSRASSVLLITMAKLVA